MNRSVNVSARSCIVRGIDSVGCAMKLGDLGGVHEMAQAVGLGGDFLEMSGVIVDPSAAKSEP